MRQIILLVSLLVTTSVFSQNTIEKKERIIHDKIQKASVTFDLLNVRCSALGYGLTELKITVPELEWLAFFDHSNIGEQAPCMTAGACVEGNRPTDLIGNVGGTEDIDVRFILKEVFILDFGRSVCTRRIEERLESVVRGVNFDHFRSKNFGELPMEECLRI